ncbi:hypothetical protein H2198_006052 [Neophaeococcomyces mojaviensis]|uniref:Uncharacterized protein n=1 Tax=Neophaeococcomyces mojaviensis TaxID=3383035 RepID=A0ACC3A421_9EURO|nr:hypothetical protein H2198_006052 [Knufia sp. JES_112]
MTSRSRSPSVESNRELESLHQAKSHVSGRSSNPTPRNLAEDNGSEQGQIRFETLTFDTEVPTTTDLRTDTIKPPNLKHYGSPFKWSATRKNICLFLSCASTFIAAYSAGSYSIASAPLQAKFHVSNEAFQTGVTTWCVGFACSPMFLAPLSELNGRRPVFLFSGFMFFVALIGCAVANSFAGMLVARFFVGAGASTFATMVGGVISDVYHSEHRNTPMALYSASALAGTGFGPMLSGFVVPRTNWRWVFWHQVIALGTVMAGMVVLFKETRGSVLLSRKATKINKYLDAVQQQHQTTITTQDSNIAIPNRPIRYTVPADAAKKNIAHMIYLSLTTPFKLLFTEPVVFFFSLWAAFAWGVLYMTLNVLPLVFRTNHNFTTEQVGATFASLIVGVLLILAISIAQEKIAKRYHPKLLSAPEGRLYFACLEAALLPIGLFWFGWTSHSSIPWIVPCLGIGCAMMGIFSIYLAVFNYLADVYHRYASSALACQSFCRNMLAAVFPLFSEVMFRRLGFPGASSLLGGVAALLTIVPWVLVFKGEKIRSKSRIAREIMETHH